MKKIDFKGTITLIVGIVIGLFIALMFAPTMLKSMGYSKGKLTYECDTTAVMELSNEILNTPVEVIYGDKIK